MALPARGASCLSGANTLNLIDNHLLLPPRKGQLDQTLLRFWPEDFSSPKKSLQVLASIFWQDFSSVITNIWIASHFNAAASAVPGWSISVRHSVYT